MWTLIIGAVVNLLIFFFQKWWTNKNPSSPALAKTAFIAEVNRPRHLFLRFGIKQAGKTPEEVVGKVFDKFVVNYQADPPQVSDSPLTEDQARLLAQKYAAGISLEQSEVN